MRTAIEIGTRIEEIDALRGTFGFFSPERKALDDERTELIEARNRMQIAAKASTAPAKRACTPYTDPEHCVTASTWQGMHGSRAGRFDTGQDLEDMG